MRGIAACGYFATVIDRRTFIKQAGLGAVVLAGAPKEVLAAPRKLRLARDAAFHQGVASGEPAARAITLWTRLEGLEKSALVGLEVATDTGFRRVVHRERIVAAGNRDWTARSRVTGLAPGEQYHYRFVTADGSSPVGRFRTSFPAGSHEPVRIAVFSCQEFIAGFYHAHADLAKRDVDLVVCLGDYVYEKAYGTAVRADTTAPDGETQTLAEYRAKYSLHHSDEHLLEVRRNFPLLAIWDDHEVEDNYAGELPGGQADNRRVPFLERRGNGYRAFFEHMPRRLRSDFRTYGRIPLGNAELFLLDTRQFRGDQPCSPTDGAVGVPCPAPITDDPARPFLGNAQKAWLKSALSTSKARWKLVANQVMITSLDAVPHNPLNTDSWDGYGADRREIVNALPADVAFLTGDIHTFFTGHVTASGRLPGTDPVRAVEFVTGAVTSPGIADREAKSETERLAAAAPLDAAVLANNPQIVFSNQAYKGYALVTAGADLKVSYKAVRDARQPSSEVFTLRDFRVEAGRPTVIDDGGPLPLPRSLRPLAPPALLPTLPPLPGVPGVR